ncbi:MAG TPA: CDP-diacylglycerol--glycerol-3-phosphate 3-phosphatidyltransferase [Nitrospirota bacterium]|nr:CDP-diacylglycerol--glycerol-3-phosphate 3-phosphatidyltransferase [Nitrospirota bacterium]
MNLPNYITLLRIILIPFFINFMIYGYRKAALIVFIVACITDALDGLIARLTNTQTELGAFFDPIADKLLIISAFVTLVIIGMLPIWFAIIVVSRDMILVLGSIALYFSGHQFVARPSIIGKATTVFQLAAVILSLTMKKTGNNAVLINTLYWIAAALTLASGSQYVFRGIKIVGRNPE